MSTLTHRRYKDALVAITEAVTIRRKLAAGSPAIYQTEGDGRA
ncbi:MAG TPA: hypothetical protein VFX16_29460 [Pseudonocardiaceae bacterium]|nr:hypothetical protein [Pseudonocardiaceae bacterium]